MASLSDVRSRIKRDLVIQTTEYDTQIDDAIRSAIRFYQGRPFWFLQKTATVTLLTGNRTVALPTDYAAYKRLRLKVNGLWQWHGNGIAVVPYNELLEEYTDDTTSARPSVLAIAEGYIHADVLADADYTISLTYYKKDTTLPSGDSDTSVWLDDGQDAIRTRAMAMFKDETSFKNGASVQDWQRADRYLSELTSTNNFRSGN